MARIIILNGPIGCGKDAVGLEFAAREGISLCSFKEPMFRIAAATIGMPYDVFCMNYENREWKEEIREDLGGHSIRHLLQQISENYIKPFFGPDYFGRQAAENLRARAWQNEFIYTDGGFAAEIDVLTEEHEVCLIHMYRDGCTFDNDTRSYVLTNKVPRIHTLTNNGTISEAADELGRILDSYDNDREPVDESDSDEPYAPVPTPRRGRSGRAGASIGATYAGRFRRGGDEVPTVDNLTASYGSNPFEGNQTEEVEEEASQIDLAEAEAFSVGRIGGGSAIPSVATGTPAAPIQMANSFEWVRMEPEASVASVDESPTLS